MSSAVPIRRKLSTITLTTCGIALLITALVFLFGALLMMRQANLQQLQTLSAAIGSNSTAALAFENPEDAGAVLAAFAHRGRGPVHGRWQPIRHLSTGRRAARLAGHAGLPLRR